MADMIQWLRKSSQQLDAATYVRYYGTAALRELGSDVLAVESWTTSAASRADERHARTGKTSNCFERLPERESYHSCRRIYFGDGTTRLDRRTEGRWASTRADSGPWILGERPVGWKGARVW